MRIAFVEVVCVVANPAELQELGLSRWLGFDVGYLGSLGRLIVCGWGIEVYRCNNEALSPTGGFS